jgi:hypothetical protein
MSQLSRTLLEVVTSSNAGEASAYIQQFDRSTFFYLFLEFGLVLVIFLAAAALVLNTINFNLRLIPAWLAHYKDQKYIKRLIPEEKKFNQSVAWITLGLITIMFIPFLFLLLWGIYTYVRVNHLLGISMFLVGLSFLLISFSFLSWRGSGWRLGTQHKLLFLCSILLLFIFELWTVFLNKPFNYLAVSCVFIGFNCIPMFLLTYHLALNSTKLYHQYARLNDNIYQDKALLDLGSHSLSSNAGNSTEKKEEEKKADSDRIVNKNLLTTVLTKLSTGVTSILDTHLTHKQMNLLLYAIAFSILVAYALVILLGRDMNNRVGWISAGVITVLDLTVFLCVFSGQITSPLTTCFYQLSCRIVIVFFGDEYFFTGHSVLYIILATFFGLNVLNHYLPYTTKAKNTTKSIIQLIQPAAAVHPHPLFPATNNDTTTVNNILIPAVAASSPNLSSLGFIKHGKWSRSRAGVFLLRYTHLISLTILTVAFLVDLLISYKSNQIALQLQNEQPQWIAGVLAFFLALLLNILFTLHRFYSNSNHQITYKVLFTACSLWSVAIVCGGYLYHFTHSVILISCFIYIPPMIYSSFYAYHHWVRNDYHAIKASANEHEKSEKKQHSENNNNIVVQVEEKKQNSDEEKEDVLSRGTTANDAHSAAVVTSPSSRLNSAVVLPSFLSAYVQRYAVYDICISCAVFFLLTVGLGLTIGIHSSPSYIGYSITSAILILASTIIPIIEWFNTFEFGKNLIIQLMFTCAAFFAYLLLMWQHGFHGDNSFGSVVLLFLLFVYPTVVILLFAVYKWKDDNWRISPFVRNCLTVSSLLITALFCALIAVVNPWEIGATLLVIWLLGNIGVVFGPRIYERYHWAMKYLFLAILCIIIAYTLAVALQPHNGFIGFSMGWAILFLAAAFLTYNSHKNQSSTQQLNCICSTNVFPVFEYDTTPGLRNPLKVNNNRIYSAYCVLILAAFWGITAVFFLQYTWIGLGILVTSSSLILLYSIHSRAQARFQLAAAVKYLEEGSASYCDTVNKAKLVALKAQYNLSKAINQGEEKNNPAAGKSSSNADAQHDLSLDENSLLTAKHTKLLQLNNDLEANEEVAQYSATLAKAEAELSSAIPALEFLSCKQGFQCAEVHFKGSSLSLSESYDLLLRLNNSLAEQHHIERKYAIHITIELILSVQAMQLEQEQLIMQMLHDTGNMSISAQDIHSCNSSERVALEVALKAWLNEQNNLKAEKQRKKKEEEEHTRMREEEERLRIAAEEQKRLEELKHSLLPKVDATIIEQQRREKEEQLKKLQQEREAEERKIIETAAAEEATRIARIEAAEARRAREAAEAAELAHRIGGEADKQRQLDALRLTQANAARLAEQKQREEMQRLEGERKAKEDAIKQAQQAAAKLINSAISNNLCTITATGNNFTYQQWFECLDCKLLNGGGCCVICRDVCHKGHHTRPGPASPGPFYCDCGTNKCLACLPPQQRQITSSKSSPSLDLILQQCAAKNQMYVDPEFPAGPAALVRNSSKAHNDWLKVEWRRPEQLANVTSPALWTNGCEAQDIRQGQIGDCWFMSALSVLTLRQKDLMDCFVTKEHNKYGVYSVNFWKDGERVNVIVDSLFPSLHNQPFFAKSNDPNELWVMVLEKAYAKLHATYEAIESGFVDQALVDLSGGIGGRVDLSKDEMKQQARNGVLFQQLLKYRELGYLLGAGSPAGSDHETNASPSGIVQGHAYSILDVQEVDSVQLIRLRNPWGRKEWTGDYSDKSAKWTRRLKAKLNYVDADDGAFWMCFQDFSIHFEDIYICRFFDNNSGWIAAPVIKSAWNASNAGGCTNYETVKGNPQYLLSITQPTSIVINLSQSDIRGTSSKLKAISVEIYSNKGRRVTREISGRLISSNPESYIFRREVSCEVLLQPASTPYTVLISTFNQNDFTQFSLKLFSNAPVKFDEAPLV